jgi:hypothetical protein
MNCNYRIAATPYTPKTIFSQVYNFKYPYRVTNIIIIKIIITTTTAINDRTQCFGDRNGLRAQATGAVKTY